MSLTAPFSAEHSADPFGDWPQWRKDMGLGPHRGKDWNKLDRGTPIPASGEGVVTWRTHYTDAEAERTELGHRIEIGHRLADGRTLYLGYSHLDENPTLDVGAKVKHRQSVGLLGNSGTASTGAHLHQTASWTSGNPGTVPTIDPMQFFTASSTAGETFTPLTSGDDDMRVFANTATNAWAVGGPGIWDFIPAGEGGYFEEAFGARIGLSPEAFTRAASVCLAGRSPEFAVYANTATDLWAVGGPGFWYAIPAGEGGLWEARFGTRKPVSSAEFERLRVAFSR